MPIFVCHCSRRSDGREYAIEVTAHSLEAARQRAADGGHIVGNVFHKPDPERPPAPPVDPLAAGSAPAGGGTPLYKLAAQQNALSQFARDQQRQARRGTMRAVNSILAAFALLCLVAGIAFVSFPLLILSGCLVAVWIVMSLVGFAMRFT